MEELFSFQGVKTSYLKYNDICYKTKTFQEWNDTPLSLGELHRNSTMNL